MARIVLVADDSSTVQKIAVGILKGEGFEVETVSNGVAAIKRLAVLHPVVILADVSMPGRDGYEVCDFVKKSADHSDVPVLLVASDMEPYDDARGAEVRADGIIKKPFEPHELISLVVKFADQFEAAIAAKSAPPPPPVEPEPLPDFSAFNEASDETPTVVEHVAPDFSAASEGMAFAEPAVEETQGFSPEPLPAEMEMPAAAPQAEEAYAFETAPAPDFVNEPPAPEPEVAPAEEVSMVVEEPPTMEAPPPSPPPSEAPTYIERLEETAPEPVFIEEQAPQASDSAIAQAEFRTMIFRAPLEIAEPVWKDETVPPPPAPEPAGAADLETQAEAEVPVAPPEIPMEQHLEPRYDTPSVTATSLDSFSLDDAAAGQVHFASQAPEAAAPEILPPAPMSEVPVPEVVISEPAAEAPSAEVASLEPVAEAAPAEMAPAEPAAEAAFAEIASVEPVEEAPSAEVASLEPVVEAVPAEITSPAPAAESIHAESVPPVSAPEGLQAEPPAEAASPAVDWGLVYTVVHRVVLRMSPPALPPEAVEEMARRLADEVFIELSSESAQPHA